MKIKIFNALLCIALVTLFCGCQESKPKLDPGRKEVDKIDYDDPEIKAQYKVLNKHLENLDKIHDKYKEGENVDIHTLYADAKIMTDVYEHFCKNYAQYPQIYHDDCIRHSYFIFRWTFEKMMKMHPELQSINFEKFFASTDKIDEKLRYIAIIEYAAREWWAEKNFLKNIEDYKNQGDQ